MSIEITLSGFGYTAVLTFCSVGVFALYKNPNLNDENFLKFQSYIKHIERLYLDDELEKLSSLLEGVV